jgi:hypothetical protein
MASLEIQVDKIAVFENKQAWINRAQRVFSVRDKYRESFICFDVNGNEAFIGEDFRIAEEQNLYPITVYRLIRIKAAQERKEATNG